MHQPDQIYEILVTPKKYKQKSHLNFYIQMAFYAITPNCNLSMPDYFKLTE